MKLKLFFAYSVLMLALLSCTDDNSTGVWDTQHKFNPIMPLADGNFWIYRGKWPDGEDTIRDFTLEAYDLAEERNQQGIIRFNNRVDVPFWQGWLYTDEQGLWMINKYSNTKTLAVKYPCKEGDTWETILYDYEHPVACSVVSINEKRIVRGKEYMCIHYRETDKKDPRRVTDKYFALNIGKVEEINYFDGKAEKRHLDTFNVKIVN